MDGSNEDRDDPHMSSNVRARSWRTVKQLHQVQVLSCDLCEFTAWEATDHCAPYWRLYWHDRRDGEIVVDEKTIPIRPGWLVLIPPNTHYASRLRAPVRQLFLHFLVEPRTRGTAGRVFELRATAEQRRYCERIEHELTAEADSLRTSLWSQILVSLALAELPPGEWTQRFEDARITRAAEAIAAAYPAWPGNAALARKAGMHPGAFIRLFRECTGHTPLGYLTNLRLEEACTMLHYSESPIDEIAERTGFGERGYFTRVFSRRMNCSPARYRSLVNVSNRARPDA